ncbi:MAG: gamma carbonic anhydrase family protein [Myxococcota bacterium]|nr:gamma carbonic anhydrase family protein [Myxococcota bacterium]MDW8361430.1 gamma carbonic anhydrase family protein [Myxococcales bacterium]
MSSRWPYRGIWPRVASDAFVAPGAHLVGDVVVGPQCSIWFGAVLRGDVMPIRVGARTSIQDNCVLHATGGWAPTLVGEDCTIGHGAILHGCSVADRVLVGMGSIVLDGAEIGPDVLLGAGSLVPPRARIPAGVLVMGRPARVVRPLSAEELERIREAATLYVGYGAEYLEALRGLEPRGAQGRE